MAKPPIHSRRFFQRLVDAGLFSEGDHVRRVVLDIEAGSAVKLYVEYYAEEPWLDIIPALADLEIITRADAAPDPPAAG